MIHMIIEIEVSTFTGILTLICTTMHRTPNDINNPTVVGVHHIKNLDKLQYNLKLPKNENSNSIAYRHLISTYIQHIDIS